MQRTMSPRTVLAIDLGTSSVKASVVQIFSPNEFSVRTRAKCGYDQDQLVNRALAPGFSQQSVGEILTCVQSVLFQMRCRLGAREWDRISLISLCGQMHGCVLWNSRTGEVSDNYDWTDGRCDPAFLRSLPTPQSYANVMSSGFACATLFWLQHNQPECLALYDRCSTIMDYLGAKLCGQLDGPTVISAHNAHSWGYFDPVQSKWNVDL